MRRSAFALTAAVCGLSLVSTPALAESTSAAQSSRPISVVASGLNGPRQLSSSHGRFYVAESDSGQVSAINPRTGVKKVVVSGLTSPQGVVRAGSKLYIAVGGPSPDTPPTGDPGAKIMVARPGGTPRVFADLLKYELKYNPDKQIQFGPNGEPLDALSNPYFIIKDRNPRGFLLVADAGANDILKVDRWGHISTFFAPRTVMTGACATNPNNTISGFGCDLVPTGLAYGPHNTLYISSLASEVPGEGRVYVLNASTGKIIRVIHGFNSPTGVAVAHDGTVYVSELLENAPEGDGPPPPGFKPQDVGRIIKVSCDNRRTYAQVTMPSGLLIERGKLYASAWSIASFLGIPDAGQVVKVRNSAFHRAQ